jgi:glycosyltransferase involved in cell wall biosynthesis
MFFSIIIPVYNRPDEIQELLESLTLQNYRDFEVIIVEDGSSVTCKSIIEEYQHFFSVKYFYIENVGQGFARNFGMNHAQGDYFVLFDSDCIIPDNYLNILHEHLKERDFDAHGGPDAAAHDFNALQKAINYSMTSFLTTGGIRGKVADPLKYEARGFNMGLSKQAFLKTGGFIDPNQAEDIELSIRLRKSGFKLELVSEAFVFHKRRNDLPSFFRQAYGFGRNRINVSKFHPEALKTVHFLPTFFLMFNLMTILSLLLPSSILLSFPFLFSLWILGIFIHSFALNRSLSVAVFSIVTSIIQLNAYGLGFLIDLIKKHMAFPIK